MSLVTVTSTLEADWQRRLRRTRPHRRWARTHPALGVDPAALRRQLDDWRSPAGRDRFAELVELARRGDGDAAILVTLTVLRAIVKYEVRNRRHAGHHRDAYDTLAGAVWEALLTSRSFKPAHLREDIVRQAWLIARRRMPLRPVTDPPTSLADELTLAAIRDASPPVAELVASTVTVAHTIDTLTAAGQLTTHGRRILESIAIGGDGRLPPAADPTRAYAQHRLRLLTRLRAHTTLTDALTA